MELLTAVNRILPKLGEHPVVNLDQKHPTLAIILPILDFTLDEVLRRGWWFNEARWTFHPDVEQFVGVPVDVLDFLPDAEGPVIRGRRFYNALTRSYKFAAPFSGVLKTRVQFAELPESVASLVLHTALVDAYVTDIGLEQVVQEWARSAALADANACAEHLRNKRYSTKRSPRWRRFRAALRG